LHIHETIFWVDASIRMQTSNLERLYQQVDTSSRGLVLFVKCAHNVFVATHRLMYRYLPISKSLAVNVTMYGSGAVFIRRSKQVAQSYFQ